MGGSAIGGDLAAAAIGGRADARRSRRCAATSSRPGPAPDTLVLCASYSGDTEETLACFEAAGEAGARRVAVTTGGKLAELRARRGRAGDRRAVGMQPRARVVYMTVGALECAALCGAAPSLRAEIEAAARAARRARRGVGPDAPEDSQAKALARRSQGTRAGGLRGRAHRGRAAGAGRRRSTRTPRRPPSAAELPEADHNEICGWERGAVGRGAPPCSSRTPNSTRACGGGSS